MDLTKRDLEYLERACSLQARRDREYAATQRPIRQNEFNDHAARYDEIVELIHAEIRRRAHSA